MQSKASYDTTCSPTWWQGVIAFLLHDRTMVSQNVGSSPSRHAQGSVCTYGEATFPLLQVGLEVALELVAGLIVSALPLQGAILPGAPQAAPSCVPVHSL